MEPDAFNVFGLSKDHQIKKFGSSKTLRAISACLIMVLFLVSPRAYSVSKNDLHWDTKETIKGHRRGLMSGLF